MKPVISRFKPTQPRFNDDIWFDLGTVDAPAPADIPRLQSLLGIQPSKVKLCTMCVYLTERQLLTLHAWAKTCTMSEAVRQILDSVLLRNDAIGGNDVTRKFRGASTDLKRTTLNITPRELKHLKLKARGQHKSVSAVLRRILDMYLFGEG